MIWTNSWNDWISCILIWLLCVFYFVIFIFGSCDLNFLHIYYCIHSYVSWTTFYHLEFIYGEIDPVVVIYYALKLNLKVLFRVYLNLFWILVFNNPFVKYFLKNYFYKRYYVIWLPTVFSFRCLFTETWL
jgi:hypothetical protein